MSSMHSPTWGKSFADFDAAFAPFREFERGRHVLASGAGLTGLFDQFRLGIESIDVRRAAVHEQVNHVLRPGSEVRRVRSERIAAERSFGGGLLLTVQDRGQPEQAEAGSRPGEDLTAREE